MDQDQASIRAKQLKDDVEDFNAHQRELKESPEIKIPVGDAAIGSFYYHYAELIERTNEFKMLYQVLLDEYRSLRILAPGECDDLRQTAVDKIFELVRKGDWRGLGNIRKRAAFRFEMMALIRAAVHRAAGKRARDDQRVAALCLSGGGIRSATFGLGVIQALAKQGLLEQFDYLSTVSGGGYIGSWLSAWMHRIVKTDTDDANETFVKPDVFSNAGAVEVSKKLKTATADSPEPPEVTHLRSYSNYMNPRTGLFSTDTWTLVAVYLRNLFLNWTVFVPLIAAFLLLPRIVADIVGKVPFDGAAKLAGAVAVAAGITAVTNINAMRPSLKTLSWVDQRFVENEVGILHSVEAKVFRWVVLWVLLFALSLTLFYQWSGGAVNLEPSVALAAMTSLPVRFWDAVILAETIFVGGYLAMWIGFGLKWLFDGKAAMSSAEKAAASHRRVSSYVGELVVSAVCGLIGGATLYGAEQLFDAGRRAARWYLPLPANNSEAFFVAAFGPVTVVMVFLVAATVFVGLAVGLTNDDDREWTARLGATLLVIKLGWLVLAAAVFFGPIIFSADLQGLAVSVTGVVSGALTLLGGFSSKTSGKPENEQPTSRSGLVLTVATGIAAPAFVIFLAAAVAWLTSRLIDTAGLFGEFKNIVWFAIFGAVGLVMGLFVNINKFSFHAIYRERLIRAYLGASRTEERLRTANSFTGLDIELDNVELQRLCQKPLHIVNMTLNLVKTQNLRWQNRKAESFTASALYCGSSNMGEGSGNYRKSDRYGRNSQDNKPISLGTAAAISGAAASPNMGYVTQNSAVAFLMVLFNVRLGWWLGNPGRRGERTWDRSAPKWSPKLFLDESVGATDDARPYVYLSDGGHFDNLGLYEMVLRRCSLIVLSDAGCDADFSFSDLGNAIHKIRVDLGITIEFDDGQRPEKGINCGVARICYSDVDGPDADDGVLIYVKPTLDGDEPIDLKNYARENPQFPHESTADQFYSETQFESYRSLGYHQIDSIIGGKLKKKTLGEIEVKARDYLKKDNAD